MLRTSPHLLPWLFLMTLLSASSILCSNFGVSILLAYLQVACLFFVLLRTGGLYKGSTSYEGTLFFLLIDLAAFFSLSFSGPWVYWVLLLPGLARLLFVFCSPHVRGVFFNCPTPMMILILLCLIPVGASLLLKLPIACPDFEWLKTILMAGAAFSGFLFLLERSRRQRAVFLLMIQTPIVAIMLLKQDLVGIPLGLLAMLNSSVWLYFLDIPTIRFFNIGLGLVNLLILVSRL